MVSVISLGSAVVRWRKEARRTSGWGGLLYVLPALTLLLTFNLWPILFSVWISFWKWDVKPLDFIGLANYQRLFGDGFITTDYAGHQAVGRVLKSLIVTAYYALGTVPITIALSFLIAYLLFHGLKGQGLFRTIFFLPHITSSVAMTVVFAWIFDARVGIANALLHQLGLPSQTWLEDPTPATKRFLDFVGVHWLHGWPDILSGPSVALVVVIIFGIWSTIGYNIVIYLAGFTSISKDLYEAGRIDGANDLDLLRNITWPLSMPSTFFLLIVNTIAALQTFSPIYTLTRDTGLGRGEAGGPLDTTLTITVYIFRYFYEQANGVGYAAAVSLLLFAIILGLTLIQFRVLGRRVHYQ